MIAITVTASFPNCMCIFASGLSKWQKGTEFDSYVTVTIVNHSLLLAAFSVSLNCKMESSTLKVNVILRWEKKDERGRKEIALAQERPDNSEIWFRDLQTLTYSYLRYYGASPLFPFLYDSHPCLWYIRATNHEKLLKHQRGQQSTHLE